MFSIAELAGASVTNLVLIVAIGSGVFVMFMMNEGAKPEIIEEPKKVKTVLERLQQDYVYRVWVSDRYNLQWLQSYNEKSFYGSAQWDGLNIIEKNYTPNTNRNIELNHPWAFVNIPKQVKLDEEGFYIGAQLKVSPQMHGVCVAGSGQGKGTCIILPNLLCRPVHSWFVLDPKGENTLITARWQKEAGQRVVLLDPWGEQHRLGATHGIEPSRFNPLAFVKGNPDEMPESCAVIAEMLVPDNPNTKDPFFESRARTLIKTYLLHIVTERPKSEQHLGTLYKWLRISVVERPKLWIDMTLNEACDGAVKDGINQFYGMSDTTGPLSSIITTAQDSTEFLQSTALRVSLSGNDFDPYSLNDGKTTVYVCLPERFLDTHSRWLRLVAGVCLKSCNYRPNKRVNFLLDEFAILGKMQAVQRAFAFSRGSKVNVHIFVQSLEQLNEIYGKSGANTFLACARLRQFFGIYDLDTQKYLSEYLGDKTIEIPNTSITTGSTNQYSSNSSNGTSESYSSSVTHGYQTVGRRLLTAEEISKTTDMIILLDGYKFKIPKIPFWENMYNIRVDSSWKQQASIDYLIDERIRTGKLPSGLDWHKIFLKRSDGHLVKIDNSQRARIT